MAKGEKKEKGVVLYYDYRTQLSLLSDEDRGRLLMALLDYGEKGTEPELDGAALMAFSFIRSQMDRNAAKYAEICRKRAEAGKKGGRPKEGESEGKSEAENQSEAKKANGFEKNQSEAKKANTNTNNKNKNKTNTNTNTNTNTISSYEEINMSPDGDTSTAPLLTSSADASAPYRDIVDLYHTICTSYPVLRTISKKRKQMMDERWAEYEGNLDTFRELFTIAEESPFLKGKNDRGWSADFNWLLDGENMPKVLEGNYSAKKSGGSFDTDEFFEAAVARSWEDREPPKTAAEDESIKARAEALKQQFAGK